ncbi:hypothetical protein [Oleisolibacter albus]|uniref:hypothetical protein n=1 Tax=Oleisolibacter albus TaxID=2171757 RepID=UPI000DF41390|nr:hypothetical protein [Oleisolibacter albus]
MVQRDDRAARNRIAWRRPAGPALCLSLCQSLLCLSLAAPPPAQARERAAHPVTPTAMPPAAHPATAPAPAKPAAARAKPGQPVRLDLLPIPGTRGPEAPDLRLGGEPARPREDESDGALSGSANTLIGETQVDMGWGVHGDSLNFKAQTGGLPLRFDSRLDVGDRTLRVGLALPF